MSAPAAGELAVLAGLACVVAIAWFWRRTLGAAAPWLAGLGATSGAVLVLTQAGRGVGYQHVRWPASGPAWVAAALAALVALLALAGARPHLPAWWRMARAELPGWRLGMVFVAFVLTCATLSPTPAGYARELAMATLLQAGVLLVAVRFAASLGAPTAARAAARADRLLGDGSPAVGIAAVLTTVAAAVMAVVVWERHPHVPDEVVYLLQARYLAEGLLAMPAPPVPGAFNIDLMFLDGARWFSPVPPGWPAVLSVGAFLGIPWLVNPVLGGVNVWLTWLVLREVHDRPTARLGALLLACSPWHLFLSMSFMTHEATLTFALLGALGVAIARRTARALPAALGGLATGVVGLIRPLEGLVVAGLLGLWSLPPLARWRRLLPSLALVAGTLATSALVFPYNRFLTGSARTFPIMAYVDRYHAPGANDLGFGPSRGLGWGGFDPFPGHGALDVLVNANLNVFATNVELLGWGTGAALAVAFLAFGRRRVTGDTWMVAVVVAVAGAHAAYWFSGGPDFGARYWYLIIVPCVALVARAVRVLGLALEERGDRGGRGRVLAAAGALTACALVIFVPWRAADKYWRFRGMRGDAARVANAAGVRANDLVFIQGRRFPDYMSAATHNPVDLATAGPLYVWDYSDSTRDDVLRAFPGRRTWVMQGPTASGRGFAVVQGPLPPGARPAGDYVPPERRP